MTPNFWYLVISGFEVNLLVWRDFARVLSGIYLWIWEPPTLAAAAAPANYAVAVQAAGQTDHWRTGPSPLGFTLAHSEAHFKFALEITKKLQILTLNFKSSLERAMSNTKIPAFRPNTSLISEVIEDLQQIILRHYKHILDEYDHGYQQNPPFLRLHIELLEHFKGSKTFTKSNPCSQSNELNSSGINEQQKKAPPIILSIKNRLTV